MKRNFLAAALVGSFAVMSAFADGSVTNSYSVPTSTTTWSQVLNVAQFDSSLGTLASITYTITGNLSGTAQASNNSTTSTDDVELNLKATLKLTRPDLSVIVQSVPIITDSEVLAVWNGEGPNPHYTPPSGITLTGLSISYSNTVSSSSLSDLALFTGTGTIPLTMKATGQSFGAGDSGNDTFNFTTLADAAITVVYNYTNPVPEASTWAAIGFVGVAAGATYIRRRRAQA